MSQSDCADHSFIDSFIRPDSAVFRVQQQVR